MFQLLRSVSQLMTGRQRRGARSRPRRRRKLRYELLDDRRVLAAVSVAGMSDAIEGGAPGAFAFMLDIPQEESTTVNYTLSGTATAGDDYTSLSGSVVFAPGSNLETVTIAADDDGEFENTEPVIIHILPSSGHGIASESAQIDILDATPAVSVAGTSDAIEGGDPGTFVFLLDIPRAEPTTVYYTVAGIATAGDDYASLNGSVVFAPGSNLETVNIAADDDGEFENTESVIIHILPSSGYGIASESAQIDILDATPSMSVTGMSDAIEGGDPGTFVFLLDIPRAEATTVYYTVAGTATAGDDYASLSGSVVFPICSTMVTVIVPAKNDAVVEGLESVDVLISPSANYHVELGFASIGILDASPTVSVYASSSEAVEGGSDGVFIFYIAPTQPVDVTVPFVVTGHATPADDYLAIPAFVVIPANSTSTTLVIHAIDDSFVESSEDVVVTLSSSTAYSLGQASAVILITEQATDMPSVVSVEFLDAEALDNAPSTDYGKLTDDNPDGGFRFFPDADRDHPKIARNLVRVRATVMGMAAGDRVAFRVFDVDDPSETRIYNLDENRNILDPRDRVTGSIVAMQGVARVPRGNDNVSASVAKQAPGFTFQFAPGTSGRDAIVWSAVKELPNGTLAAEIDVQTSMNPGDNIRVGAMPQAKQNFLQFSTTTEPFKETDGIVVENTAYVPSNGAHPGNVPLTSQLAIWRHICVENDTRGQYNYYSLMKATSERVNNRFADAFIEPDYTAVNDASINTSKPPEILTELSPAAMRLQINAHRQSKPLDTPQFWAVYVTDVFAEPTPPQGSPRGTRVWGETLPSYASSVYSRGMGQFFVNGNDANIAAARTTVHEVGHQLLRVLGHTGNAMLANLMAQDPQRNPEYDEGLLEQLGGVMNANAISVRDVYLYFIPEQVVMMRRMIATDAN